MQKLFTENQFINAQSRDLLPLRCNCCQKIFHRTKHRIHDGLNLKRTDSVDFCSQKCNMLNKFGPPNLVNCHLCGKLFTKHLSQVSRTKNNFCSQSCAATYNNTHKTKGSRRSKLEMWLQEQLITLYPNLEIHYNRTDAINAELDIYIPSLKLAFELNGIFHYEPIYGPEKLASIKTNDQRKFQACGEKSISLCTIDTSSQKYFKAKTSKKFLDIIHNTISNILTDNRGLEPHSGS